MALPYYKRHPRDFIEGTVGMPLELKGAYAIVLDIIYMQSGDLVDDDRYISGLLGCSIRKWKSLKKELVSRGKITVKDGVISNKRARVELETTAKYQDNQAQNRTNPNKNKDLQSRSLNHSRDYPEPEPDKPPTPLKGGATFERFWVEYPQSKNNIRSKANEAFEQLSVVDQELAVDGAGEYRKSIDGEGKKFVKRADRWLADRQWEAFEKKTTIETVSVDRFENPALFSACEAAAGKKAITSIQKWSWPVNIVDEAKILMNGNGG